MNAAARLAAALALLPPLAGAEAPRFGGQEHVNLVDGNRLEIVAQLDPKADVSQLYAYGISYFSGDGGTWASFTVDSGTVLPGPRVTIKTPLLHDQKVHLKNGARAHRPMVALRYCIGSRVLSTQVELIPRTGYTPSLVLGGDALGAVGAVDLQRKFTIEPDCKAAEGT